MQENELLAVYAGPVTLEKAFSTEKPQSIPKLGMLFLLAWQKLVDATLGKSLRQQSRYLAKQANFSVDCILNACTDVLRESTTKVSVKNFRGR